MDVRNTWARAGRGPIVLGDDFDQDRSRVDQVNVGRQVVGQGSVWSDLRLHTESGWVQGSDVEADGLAGRTVFVRGRRRTSNDVGQEAW